LAHPAGILARATAIALILALPPIVVLLYLWGARLRGPLEVVVWIILSLLWNSLILMLLLRMHRCRIVNILLLSVTPQL